MLIVFNKSTVCQCWEKKWVILRRNKQKNVVINVCMLWNRNELRTKSSLGWNDYGRFKWKLRRIPKRDFQKSALLYVHLKREEVLHPNMSAKTTPGPGVNRVLDVNKPQDEHKKNKPVRLRTRERNAGAARNMTDTEGFPVQQLRYITEHHLLQSLWKSTCHPLDMLTSMYVCVGICVCVRSGMSRIFPSKSGTSGHFINSLVSSPPPPPLFFFVSIYW